MPIADPIYKSDLVTEDMVSFDAGFLRHMIAGLVDRGPDVTESAMFILLSAAAWDVRVLDMCRGFLETLLKEGIEGVDSNIKATAVLMGLELPQE